MSGYKLTNDNLTVIRLSDNAHVPMQEGNRDYNEFVEWLNQGNQPLPADPIEEIKVPDPVPAGQ